MTTTNDSLVANNKDKVLTYQTLALAGGLYEPLLIVPLSCSPSMATIG